MEKRERRRHHRVAEREICCPDEEGFILSGRCVKRIICGVVVFSVIVFLKGILIGLWIARE